METPAVVDVASMRFLLAALAAWLNCQQQKALGYLIEENRILRAQLRERRLRLTDEERRRLAVRGQRLGRRALSDVATIVTPDTIRRWHRQLVARKAVVYQWESRKR
jgi:putative transposase